MMRIFQISVAFAAVAVLTSPAVFGQVNFAFDWNVQEPEEVDGWDDEAIRIAFDEVGDSQQGVTFDNAVTGDYSTLEFDFELRISNEDGEGDADGIGFAFANVDIFGESAEDDVFPNYSGEEPNLEGSIGVGFDTWMNSAIDDPDAGGTFGDLTVPNSFSLHYDGQTLITLPMQVYDLDEDWLQSPSVKRAHIEIEAGDDEALVTVEVTDTETGVTVTAFDKEIIPDFEPYDGRITFRARTGGEDSNHDLDNISLTLVEPDGTRQEPVVHYGRYVGGSDGDPCDYDGDGSLGEGDVNALSAAIASGDMDSKFDVNGDGVVNVGDLNFFVTDESKLHTWMGDANLDGEFGSSDLVAVFTAGKYETGEEAQWSQGDWNADLRFGSGDLVVAFSDGGYELGPKWVVDPEPAAVPEPSGLAILLTASCLLFLRRRSD